MATTERAQEYMRNFRIANLETHCDRDSCHGTHVDRIDWEIALRCLKQLGTEEVMAELDDKDKSVILKTTYMIYAYQQWSGRPMAPPPFKHKPNVIVPHDVREAGFDPEDICWACDDSECAICIPKSSRLQQVVLRERRSLRVAEFLNREDIMQDFLNELEGVRDPVFD